jgi:tRNA1(Val) A37 N6-methylase TrmN6
VLGELTDDAICGSWRIFQRRRGHRYSLDDVATARQAVLARPDARRYCDLGSGIGSVLIMVAYKLQRATLFAVEAQAMSFELLRRNVERNEISATLWHGDLRDPSLPERSGGDFDLVTGTPPYLPPDRGSPSTDEQRTYARLEMRGGVEEYVKSAARLIATDGRVVVCCDARRPERAMDAGASTGLVPLRRCDVIPRADHKGALFTVWTFGREGELVIDPPLVARDKDGARTEDAHALRRFFDLEPNEAEPPSRGKTR